MSEILGLSFSNAIVPTVQIATSFSGSAYYESAPDFRIYRYHISDDEKRTLSPNEASLFYLSKLIADSEAATIGTGPLVLRYNRKSVAIHYSGVFSSDFVNHLQFQEKTFFAPRGNGPDERLLCWIFDHLHSEGFAQLGDALWSNLTNKLREILHNEKVNILISDGDVMLGFCNDITDPLCFRLITRLAVTTLESGSLKVDFQKLSSAAQLIALASGIKDTQNWDRLSLGQLIVVRNGAVLWHTEWESTAKTSIKECVIDAVTTIPSKRMAASFEADQNLPINTYLPVTNKETKVNIFSVLHESSYRYTTPITNSKHLFRLRPISDVSQSLESYELISSSNGVSTSFMGVFGNSATLLEISEPYTELKLTSRSIVALSDPEIPPQGFLENLTIPLIWMPWDRIMMQAYLTPPELAESELQELSAYAMRFVKKHEGNIISVLDNINTEIYQDFSYTPNSTDFSTTAFDVYLNRKGVCQDFSNFFICLARLLNVPARYRVGYLYTGGEYSHERAPDQTHAWVELYLPRIGWTGFDPTNGTRAGKSHIRVATGRNYRDATPTSGVVYSVGARETLSTFVQVTLLNL